MIKTGLYQNSIMHATRYGPGVAFGMHGKDRSLWSLLIVLVGKLVLNYPINIKTDKDRSQAQITLATNGKLVLNYPINIKTDKDRSQAQIST